MTNTSQPERPCTKCGTVYPKTGEFFYRKGDGYLYSECKCCTKRRTSAYQKANPEVHRMADRRWQKRRYWRRRIDHFKQLLSK